MAVVLLKQSLSEHFGEATTTQVEQFVVSTTQNNSSLDQVLPHGAAFLLAGVVQQNGGFQDVNNTSKGNVVLHTNASAMVRSLVPKSGTSYWTTASEQAFGQRLLQVPEAEFRFLSAPGSNDLAALRFLANAMQKNMSGSDLSRALKDDPEGQQCLEAFQTSPTLGSVVMYASIWSWWDDVLDWLEGAAQWVKDAYEQFGEWATKQANAVVDAVFSKFQSATDILENIPGVGLVVAAIYAIAGKSDQAWAALAINVNSIVTLIGTAVGFWLLSVPGAMIGAAMGKAVGLLLQEAIASFIKDPTLKAEVGDISAASFIIQVAMSGAAGAASNIGSVLAVAIQEELGSEVGMSIIAKLGLSQVLAALLAKIPGHFATKYAPDDKAEGQPAAGSIIGTLPMGPGLEISSGGMGLGPEISPGILPAGGIGLEISAGSGWKSSMGIGPVRR